MGSEQPNVVLVCVDQWRGDCLSSAGHPVVRTPYLDELAERGTRFARAYSSSPTCIPARVALHTGLSQEHHGRVGYRDGVPWRYPVTLAGEFGRHGYQTRAIGKLHVTPERHRIGFDEVTLHDGYLRYERARHRDPRFYDDYRTWLRRQPGETLDADYFDHGVNCNSVVSRPWDGPERLHPTPWVVTEALDFLYRRDPTAPFFLHLSFNRPHPPFDPPAWAFEQYLAAPQYEPVVGDWVDVFTPWRNDHNPQADAAQYDPVTIHRARAGYYGHMAHIDQQINRFVEVLREFRLAENTWICFTSDHGEMLGDHRLWHKSVPYEGAARVPLLLAGPRDAIRVGAVSDQVVELRDVMPTLLDVAGLPVPDGLDGASLLPLARSADVLWRDHLHGEHITFDQSLHWIATPTDKYVWFSADGHEQLFDLIADPAECHDLAASPEHGERLAARRALLIDSLRDRPEGFVAGQALVPSRPVGPHIPGLLD